MRSQDNFSRNMGKYLRVGVFAMAGVLAAAGAQAEISVNRLTIGTGPAGSLYGQLGATFATIIQEHSNANSTARPHGGTSQYLPALQRGEIDLGLNSSLDSGLAYNGGEPYGAEMRNLRGVAQILQAPFSFIVKDSSGMKTIADVKGKRVNVRNRGLAAFTSVNQAVLATAGLTEEDVKSIDETNVLTAMQALPEDRLDVTNSILFVAAHREADSAIPGGTRVLSLGDNHAPIEALPGFTVRTVQPRQGWVGILEPTTIAFMGSLMTTGVHMKEGDIYEVAKILHTNWKEAQEALPALRGLKPEDMVPAKLSVPFHDGAIRYFREAGLWTADHDKQQAALLSK